ncbi:hypothetical protein HPB51_022760 [Rhipicephalus microplus]|uniref:Uncharacterized protein n=1 Tax=Rhipicephalus microplus TaxID=6941 RepID=A0A9J6EIN9_RHIMP|nr:hypothetical protein HPB51_022760 [Rhipicephalus microplus]
MSVQPKMPAAAALATCDHMSADTFVAAVIAEIASSAITAALHPWSTTLRAVVAAAESGAHGPAATRHSAVGELWGAEATAGGNLRPLILVTAHVIIAEKASNHAAAALHQWSTIFRAAAAVVKTDMPSATTTETGAVVLSGAEATAGGNLRGPFLVTARAIAAEMASNTGATALHPWSTTLIAVAAAAESGVHGAAATGPTRKPTLPNSTWKGSPANWR